MQDPANMPRDRIRQVEEMKQASMVCQFQSIEILQDPPILMPPMLPMSSIPVPVGPIVEVVILGPILMVDDAIDMSMFPGWRLIRDALLLLLYKEDQESEK